tara:strand:- start:242 stop:583 length:342 start_codon:yes stop_codon:yes gene_type:complete
MKTSVVVSFSMEGFHCWPEAKEVFPEVGFLSDRHRHQFGFRCYAYVTHSDRDEEFILMQRRIKKQLRGMFGGNILEFGRMSCEDIAEYILEANLNLYKVEVWEDWENGAIVER